MTKLKPCLFCKSKRILFEKGSIHEDCNNFVVLCLECGVQYELPIACTGKNYDAAIKFWNNRREI